MNADEDKALLLREIERLRARMHSAETQHFIARFALEHAPTAFYLLEEDARIAYVNRATCELMGYSLEEMLAMKVSDLNIELADMGRWAAVWALLKGGGQRRFEGKHRRKDGVVLTVEVSATFVAFGGNEYSCAFVRDITPRKALEERLQQAEKMEAMGRLAGGIAHDFNNQLAGIMGCADLLRREVTGEQRATQLVDDLEKTVRTASELTAQLLAFSRRGKFLIEPVDLDRAIDEVTRILSRSIDKKVTIETIRRGDTAWTMGDPSQLQNAILNVALNARDAMRNGGTITIRTRRTTLDADMIARQQLNVPPGEYVALSVRDTGVGMGAETQQRVFEPFFTTKEGGSGTGLGMAAVYGTVKNHKGAIHIESELGRGTEITMYLPASRSGAHARPDPGEIEPIWLEGRVMLVEDEPRVRKVTGEMLGLLGLEVGLFPDGKSATTHYREHHETVDLVLLDMVMPEQSGSETFAALRAIDPEVPVVIMSGYSQDGDAQSLIDAGAAGFLQKPFSMAQLAGQVRRALRR